jgi:hypothetical protein
MRECALIAEGNDPLLYRRKPTAIPGNAQAVVPDARPASNRSSARVDSLGGKNIPTGLEMNPKWAIFGVRTLPREDKTMFRCQECGRKFKTARAAEKASFDGCPKCGGCDIDTDPAPDRHVELRKGRALLSGGLAEMLPE